MENASIQDLQCAPKAPGKFTICFVSYEYPGDINPGGVATYIYQISEMLSRLGHSIHVITAGSHDSLKITEAGANISLIRCSDHSSFRALAADKFKEINILDPIDVVETTDWGADAALIAEKYSHVPIVMRLHTSTIQLFIVNKLIVLQPWYPLFCALIRCSSKLPFPWLLRFLPRSGGLRYVMLEDAIERRLASKSILLAAPTPSMVKFSRDCWGFKLSRYRVVPLPFSPSSQLISIEPPSQVSLPECITILFVGRLEARKGVIDLVKAAPIVKAVFPMITFRLVGPVDQGPSGYDMAEYLESRHRASSNNIKIVGNIPYEELPHELSRATICVFPSLWENFPCVCLEAMAAARPIIGSRNGGMRDMLDNGAGLLVAPARYKTLAQGIIKLLSDPASLHSMGMIARQKIVSYYSSSVIGEQHVGLYKDAMRGYSGRR